jgi:hypothetical protein
MKFVIMRPNDDDDIVELLAVRHDGTGKKATMLKFQTQWDACLARVKKLKPETWDVSEVIRTMEHQGWTIMRLDYTTVTY